MKTLKTLIAILLLAPMLLAAAPSARASVIVGGSTLLNQSYLDTLENSMRGSRTRAEADQLIAQAHQTRGYLNQLLAESRASLD